MNKIDIDKEALELAKSLKDRFTDPEYKMNIARGIFLFADHLKLLGEPKDGAYTVKDPIPELLRRPVYHR